MPEGVGEKRGTIPSRKRLVDEAVKATKVNIRVLKCEDAPTLVLSSTVGRFAYAEMTGYSLSTLASRFRDHQ